MPTIIEQTDSFPVYGTTLCIIDTASSGPILEPYKAEDDREVKIVFGKDSNLTKAHYVARESGATEIWLVRVDPKVSIDGTTYDKEDMYDQLEQAYQSLEAIAIHIIIPSCVYFEDDGPNYALQLAKHCDKASQDYGARIGVIGVPPIDESLILPSLGYQEREFNIKEYTNSLIDSPRLKKGFYNDFENDIGYLISIVASEALFGGPFGSFAANGAVAYAGLLSTLLPSESPNNKFLRSIVDLSYGLPSYHAESMVFTDSNPKSWKLFKKPEEPIVVRDSIIGKDYSKDSYTIDYDNKQFSWNIVPGEEAPSADILYNINDYKGLSEAGYVVFLKRVRSGIVPYSSSIPSKTSMFSTIQSVRTAQSIVYTIKHAALEFAIGETEMRVSIFMQWVKRYLEFLQDGQQIQGFQLSFEKPSLYEIKIVLALTLFSEVSNIPIEISVRGALA